MARHVARPELRIISHSGPYQTPGLCCGLDAKRGVIAAGSYGVPHGDIEALVDVVCEYYERAAAASGVPVVGQVPSRPEKLARRD